MKLQDLNPKQGQWNIQLKGTTSGRELKRFGTWQNEKFSNVQISRQPWWVFSSEPGTRLDLDGYSKTTNGWAVSLFCLDEWQRDVAPSIICASWPVQASSPLWVWINQACELCTHWWPADRTCKLMLFGSISTRLTPTRELYSVRKSPEHLWDHRQSPRIFSQITSCANVNNSTCTFSNWTHDSGP